MFTWGVPNATLFFASILAGLVLVRRGWKLRRESSEADQVFRVFLLLGCAAAAAICLPSLLSFQKWLTKLAMPPGILWLGLLVLGATLGHYRWRTLSALAWLLWLVLTLSGSETVSRRLLAGLEREFATVDPLSVASADEPFDLVVALGGSTRVTPAGQVELTEAGDRILVAARLYHAGHTRLLVATGEPNVELLGPDRYPAEEARVLWRGLGIPREAIVVLDGLTTRDEFQVIAQEAEQRGWKRIGVVTSAWHMGRALRLAKAANLQVEPLPADFIGDVPEWRRVDFVPTGQGVYESSRALKEYLARLVGR